MERTLDNYIRIPESRYERVSFRKLMSYIIPSTTYATHGLYMYPAKFIPHVVRFAIEKYLRDRESPWVFDPFAGSGTVAVEATLAGVNYLLWDLNPITELLVKASTWQKDVSLKELELDFEYLGEFQPKWRNLNYWHPPEFLEILRRVWAYYHEVVPDELKPLVAIPLLKVTRYFSYSDEKIAKLYRSKYAKKKVTELLKTDFQRKMKEMYFKEAKRVVEKIKDYHRRNPKKVRGIVHAGVDSIEMGLEREVDLLLTSPPYLQAQEYIRSFKLELFWLGYPEEKIRSLSKLEIPYRKTPEDEVLSDLYWEYREKVEALNHPKLLKVYDCYFKSLARFLNNIHENVTDRMAIFVGPVKVRGIRVPIDEILREHLENLGWIHERTYIDEIVARRLFKSKTNPATGLPDERTPTEHLLVMRR
ncbi:DNA adenine methylase [Thermococcus sp.]